MFGANRFKLSSLLKIGMSSICLVFVLASCGSAPVPVAAPRAAQPEWTSGGLHDRYNSHMFLTAVGHGNTRQAAEMDAFRQLVTIFGVDVQADARHAEAYRSIGAISRHEVEFGSEIVLGAGMDNLIGARIGERWDDGRGSHFALATLNRAEATRIYSEMIRANQELIANLTTFASPAERNTLGGFSRYQFAAVIADMNASYAAVLSAVGSPQHAQGLRTGDDFRREMQGIANAIPIGINVNNDRAGRLQGAFAAAFTEFGFRTGGTNPRYVLNVNVVLQPTEHSGRNVFARMELTANLVDTVTGAVLLPYTFNIREGHTIQSEAENRTFISAERRINDEYREMLSDYLSQLLPR